MRKFKSLHDCFFIIILALLVGCVGGKEEEAHVPNQDLKSFTYKDQNFEIITYEEEFKDYLIQLEDTADLNDIYHSSVLESFRTQAFGEEEGYSLVSANDWHFTPPENKESLEKTLSYLAENQDFMLDTIKNGIQDSVDMLPGGDKEIHVFPMNPDNLFGRGTVDDLSGFTWNEDFMLIMVGRNFSAEELSHLIAHEYHHTVYNETNETDFTLLESSVVEGKAEVFAEMIYPDVHGRSTEPLRGRYKKDAVEIFLNHLDSTDPVVHGDFYFGYPSEGIPELAMYRIGYQIVKGYIKENPDATLEEWTDISSEEIFKESSFRK